VTHILKTLLINVYFNEISKREKSLKQAIFGNKATCHIDTQTSHVASCECVEQRWFSLL